MGSMELTLAVGRHSHTMECMEFYERATKLGKIFMWLSLLGAFVFVGLFTWYVISALTTDPNSPGCLYDSLIAQTCQHPISSSFGWAILGFVFLAWPVYIPWLVVGSLVFINRIAAKQIRTGTKEA